MNGFTEPDDGYQITTPRLTLAETLEVCNRVRAAGGAGLLAALEPGVPEDSESCLIARNLNFGCVVTPAYPWTLRNTGLVKYDSGERAWLMFIESASILEQISEAMDWPIAKVSRAPGAQAAPEEALLLPPELGRVALAFDQRHSEFDGSDLIAESEDEDG